MMRFTLTLFFFLIVVNPFGAESPTSQIENEMKTLKDRRQMLRTEIKQIDERILKLEQKLKGGKFKPEVVHSQPQLM